MFDALSSDAGMIGAVALGFIVSVLKQLIDAKNNGAAVGPAFARKYFADHWIETTFALVGSIVLFSVAALTGQLNVMSALGAGYAGNSIADFLSGTAGTRSRLIANQQPADRQ
jgi:hypothetical protein